MLIIGSHVNFTSKDQMLGSFEQALSYGSNAFMFYTGAPQNTTRVKIDKEKTSLAIEKIKSLGMNMNNVIVHSPYIINLANNKETDKYNFSINFLKEEVKRCSELGVKYLVLHPGSHVGLGTETGINNIINALNIVNESNNDVVILLETMAGKGTEIGSNFDEIKTIIDGINKKELIGVCLDTCHLNDSGYNISDFDSLLDEFDKQIGLSYIHCVHVNDSKNPIESHKDRHENIGFGTLGFDNIINVCYNKRLENIPKILETPYVGDNAPYKLEIEMLKSKNFDSSLKEKLTK